MPSTPAASPATGDRLRNCCAVTLDAMCDDCRTRFERNIWRILDCKQPACGEIVAGAPDYAASFGEDSRRYFDEVRRALDALKIPYKVDPRLVRGLDYYVHTVFEVTHPALGPQTAIAGGGRYELFLPGGKRPVPGVGFAAGVERLLLAREALGVKAPEPAGPVAYLIGLNAQARLINLALADELRAAGVPVGLELEERSFKAQLREANRSGAPLAVVRGDSEIEKNTVIVKNMADGAQTEISADAVFEFLQKRDPSK